MGRWRTASGKEPRVSPPHRSESSTAAGSGWIWGVGGTVCGADGQLDACLEEKKNQGVARSRNCPSLGERTGALVISLNDEIFLLVNHFFNSLFSSHTDVPPVLEISHDQVLNTPSTPDPNPHHPPPLLRSPFPPHACCQVSTAMESCHCASCIRMMSAGARINYWHAL